MGNRSLKKSIGLRLSGEALRLLKLMAGKSGLSQAGVIELAIREKATREGLEIKTEADAVTTGI